MTKHFSRSEFSCKCCGKSKVSNELLAVLELVRSHFGEPVVITSGYRCPEHNKAVGGAPNSKHLLGVAADIHVKNTDSSKVYKFLNDIFPDVYGIGLYSNWTHIDVRKKKARW